MLMNFNNRLSTNMYILFLTFKKPVVVGKVISLQTIYIGIGKFLKKSHFYPPAQKFIKIFKYVENSK